MEEELKVETFKTKFRLLAIISMIQTILLWYILNNDISYHFSVLENVLVITLIVIFYIILFAKKHIQALINKVLNW